MDLRRRLHIYNIKWRRATTQTDPKAICLTNIRGESMVQLQPSNELKPRRTKKKWYRLYHKSQRVARYSPYWVTKDTSQKELILFVSSPSTYASPNPNYDGIYHTKSSHSCEFNKHMDFNMPVPHIMRLLLNARAAKLQNRDKLHTVDDVLERSSFLLDVLRALICDFSRKAHNSKVMYHNSAFISIFTFKF